MLVTNTMIIKAVEHVKKVRYDLSSVSFDKIWESIDKVQKDNNSLEIRVLSEEIERLQSIYDKAIGRLEGLLIVFGEQ